MCVHACVCVCAGSCSVFLLSKSFIVMVARMVKGVTCLLLWNLTDLSSYEPFALFYPGASVSIRQ